MTRMIILLMLLSGWCVAAQPVDYTKARMDLAASTDYQPYALMGAHQALVQRHFELAEDPDASIDDLNAPLQELYALYPLGVQVNRVIAGFLEHIAEGADPEERDELLDLARQRRAAADDVLQSILRSGDGKTMATAYQVINLLEEYAVLEHLGLERIEQSLVEGRSSEEAYDLLRVKDAQGREQALYFDVSLFIGKGGGDDDGDDEGWDDAEEDAAPARRSST